MKNHPLSETQRGFTLIELLIVIAIIGILAGTVLISVQSSRARATNVKIQTEVTQMRGQLEQSFANNSYLDLSGAVSHRSGLVSTSTGYANLSLLLCDIGKQNGYSDAVANDIVLTCDGNPGQHSGVIIYSNQTGWAVSDYAVYATTTPSGYVCIDSFGNTNSTTTVSIPVFASITSTSTALCQ